MSYFPKRWSKRFSAYSWIISDVDGWQICEVPLYTRPKKDVEINASLIAAAPSLLGACRKALKVRPSSGARSEITQLLREAVKLAEEK